MTATQTTLDIVRAKFDFSVDKFPLSGPDGLKTPKYGLFRSDNGEFVGDTVTKRYVPHLTEDVVAVVEATQSVFSDCSAECSFRDGHYVSLAPSKGDCKTIFDNGGSLDTIFPRLTVRAGYDGKAFSMWLGWFRHLCKNLSMMRTVKETCVRIRHTSNLRMHMDELVDQLSGLKENWQNLGDLVDQMESAPVRLAAFLDSVYGTPTDGRGLNAKNRTEKIFRRVLKERQQTKRPELDELYTVSAWEAYNAVQGYVQHDAFRKNSIGNFDRVILANFTDPAVLKAEKLAMEAIAA